MLSVHQKASAFHINKRVSLFTPFETKHVFNICMMHSNYYNKTNEMNVLVMQSLKQSGHTDQQITHYMLSYERSTGQHGEKTSERLRGLGTPSVGSEHGGKACYNLNDNDDEETICSITYGYQSIQSL